MGYQPGLDGLRALSVVLVILYHAGVARHAELTAGQAANWFFDGGFLGVEVFFVVSGFLITSLMLEERATHGRVVLHQFWLRRFRRLLPALWVMIAACGVWATFWGHDFLADLKADSFFGLFYGANFQQLASKVSYFGGFPHLLRHLWSLAVEEHFYLFFPLMFTLVLRRPSTPVRRLLRVTVPAAVASMVAFVLVWKAPVGRLTDQGVQLDDVRQNWAYLSTFTRMGGILLGVSLAVVWSPWKPEGRRQIAGRAVTGRRLDAAGLSAMAGIVVAALALRSDSAALYRGGLAAVSVLSFVAIAVVVHPDARLMRAVFGNPAMAAIGRRSYGLYLWHWPIFVGPLAGRSIGTRLLVGGAATVVLSELCYRFVETPIRHGAISRWFRSEATVRVRRQPGWLVRSGATVACVAGVALFAGSLVVRLVSVERSATGVGGFVTDAEMFDPSALAALTTTSTGSSTLGSEPAPDSTAGVPVPSASATTLQRTPANAPPLPPLGAPADQPRRLVILGDSQGVMLFGARPSGLGNLFTISGGALSGCSVFDEGKLLTNYPRYSTKFDRCAGWEAKWATAVTTNDADLALVVLGAWDVFDLEMGDHRLVFGTSEFDQYWLAQLQLGIDAIKAQGAQVALLEVECMRPQDVKGQGTPPLPERADDARTGHVNELLARAAAADPTHVFYVPAPHQWCDDADPISHDLKYRWDGVHVSGKGGKLVFETITPSLLAIPLAS